MLLVCINRNAPTCGTISDAGVFGVNILTEDQIQLAERFATPSADKFVGVAVEEGVTGVPLLSAALARLECRVVEEVRGAPTRCFSRRSSEPRRAPACH